MSVTIRRHEMSALVKMLEHEHFSYGNEGLAALSAFKKIDAALQEGEELVSVKPSSDRSDAGQAEEVKV